MTLFVSSTPHHTRKVPALFSDENTESEAYLACKYQAGIQSLSPSQARSLPAADTASGPVLRPCAAGSPGPLRNQKTRRMDLAAPLAVSWSPSDRGGTLFTSPLREVSAFSSLAPHLLPVLEGLPRSSTSNSLGLLQACLPVDLHGEARRGSQGDQASWVPCWVPCRVPCHLTLLY